MFGRNKKAGPVYRHEARDRDLEWAEGRPETIEAVVRHLTTFVGPPEHVFFEIVSDLVKIDVHRVQPAEDRPFWTLMTSGMSDRPMTLPRKFRGKLPDRAELMILLPPTWPLDEESFKEDRHYWPVRQLKTLARLPHEYDSWLGAWHSAPNGDPPVPFEGTRFCATMLAPPTRFPDEFRTFRTSDGRDVAVFAVIPLLPDELTMKLARGVEVLFPGMERYGVDELFDPRRRTVLRP